MEVVAAAPPPPPPTRRKASIISVSKVVKGTLVPVSTPSEQGEQEQTAIVPYTQRETEDEAEERKQLAAYQTVMNTQLIPITDKERNNALPPYWSISEKRHQTDFLETMFLTEDTDYQRREGLKIYDIMLQYHNKMGPFEKTRCAVAKKSIDEVHLDPDSFHYLLFVCLLVVPPFADQCRRTCPPYRILPFCHHLEFEMDLFLMGNKYPTKSHFVWAMRELYLERTDDYHNTRRFWGSQLPSTSSSSSSSSL